MPASTEPSPEAAMNTMRAVAENNLRKLKTRRNRIRSKKADVEFTNGDEPGVKLRKAKGKRK